MCRMAAEIPYAEACERNKAPILDALLQRLPQRGHVLEIGSGSGQHVVYFAPHFERLTWQPSERAALLPGLNARIRREAAANVLPAIVLDVNGIWPDRDYAAVFSANTAHIMAWPEVCAMFAGIGQRLAPGGGFCLYGPFNVGGNYTAPSNAAFDRQLQARDPEMGLRDTDALDSLAREHRMLLEERVALPANNQLLVFRSRRGR